MRVLTLDEIRPRIDDLAVIGYMRDALIAHSRGECETPLPLPIHLGEARRKASYRGEGNFYGSDARARIRWRI